MSGIFELAANAALETINEELLVRSKEDHLSFYRLIATLRIDQRLYFLTEDMVADQIWPYIRNDEALLDMVLRMAQGFSFRVHGSIAPLDFDALVNTVSRAIAVTGTRKPGRGVIDDEVSRLTPNASNLRNLLQQEPWLVFLLVAERIATAFLPTTMLTPPSRVATEET